MMNKEYKMIEVRPLKDVPLISETLSRIGIANIREKKLYQSCHIICLFNKFYIAHFKQLFMLSKNESGECGYGNISREDLDRRNAILKKILSWNMVELVNKEDELLLKDSCNSLFILPYNKKNDWTIVSKFNTKNLMVDINF